MDIQKTKAKCKPLPCIISTKEHPKCCRFLPLSCPSRGRRGSFPATHYSNACTDFVSCCWDSTMSEPSMPHALSQLFQPTRHPASWFQLHINLLLSMEKWMRKPSSGLSRPFLVSHFPLVIMAILPHMHSEMKSVAPGSVEVKDSLFDFSRCVGSRLKAFCFLPRLALIQGRVSLSKTQEARKLPCTYSMKLFLVFHWN